MMTLIPVEPGFHIEAVGALPPPSAAVQAEIDRLWDAERARRPELFDGTILAVLAHDARRVTAGPIPYRRLLAQVRQPALAPVLALLPLAVTGMVMCDDGLVLGLRGGRVTQDVGRWEFAPSGSVDASALLPNGGVDAAGLVQREMHEELGIAPELVRQCRLLALAWDQDSPVLDLIYGIRVAMSGEALLRGLPTGPEAEHDRVEVVPPARLAAFLNAEGERAAAPTLALMPLALTHAQETSP
jgi:hypothetical protein